MKNWIFVEVGNWYSEYKCPHCKKHVVTQDDGDPPYNSIIGFKNCPHCKEPVGHA